MTTDPTQLVAENLMRHLEEEHEAAVELRLRLNVALAERDNFQLTQAELARHNAQLTHDLIAAEQRAREAEARVKLLTSAGEDYRDDLRVAEAESARWKEAHDVCCAGGQQLVERCDEKDAEIARLQGEVEDWKRGSQEEARQGDAARAEVAAMRAVVEAAHLVLDHEMTVDTYNRIRDSLAALDKPQVRMAGASDPT